jgi:hypothetical protein
METEAPTLSAATRVTRIIAAVLVAAFVALLGYGLIAQAPEQGIDDALADNRSAPAPPFELEVLADGRPAGLGPAWRRAASDGRVGITELRGTPLVLNFWASWCVPDARRRRQHGRLSVWRSPGRAMRMRA